MAKPANPLRSLLFNSIFFRYLEAPEIELERDYPRAGSGYCIRYGAVFARLREKEQTASAACPTGLAVRRAGLLRGLEELVDLRICNGWVERLLMLPAFAEKGAELAHVLIEKHGPHTDRAVTE